MLPDTARVNVPGRCHLSRKGADVAVLITPAMGAHFIMFFAKMHANSSASQALPGVERFVFVLSGEVLVTEFAGGGDDANPTPSPQTEHTLKVICAGSKVDVAR
eukprot:jgi/Mesvir1/28816/Mv24161-RA.1